MNASDFLRTFLTGLETESRRSSRRASSFSGLNSEEEEQSQQAPPAPVSRSQPETVFRPEPETVSRPQPEPVSETPAAPATNRPIAYNSMGWGHGWSSNTGGVGRQLGLKGRALMEFVRAVRNQNRLEQKGTPEGQAGVPYRPEIRLPQWIKDLYASQGRNTGGRVPTGKSGVGQTVDLGYINPTGPTGEERRMQRIEDWERRTGRRGGKLSVRSFVNRSQGS